MLDPEYSQQRLFNALTEDKGSAEPLPTAKTETAQEMGAYAEHASEGMTEDGSRWHLKAHNQLVRLLCSIVKLPSSRSYKTKDKMSYTIQSGDTFWAIAQKLGVSVDALQAANPGVNPSLLQIGQTINLPGGGNNNGGDKPSPPPSGGIVGATGGSNGGGDFVPYSGPASAYPDPSQWASYTFLWAQNSRLMLLNSSPHEVDLIHRAIETVSASSGVDVRCILVIIVQESGGNVRVGSTNNGVHNPGLMQSHNGVSFNPADPEGSILQMVRDGTEGTRHGDGLKQLLARYGNYYEAFRGYNSGSVNKGDLNDPVGATGNYVQKAANRLMGHSWAGM
ncbi:MAG: hypothetical protein Q9180_009279 [Flavoplaca navasiana]